MSWADWMVVNPTMEQELQIEKNARIPLLHDDAGQVRELCSKLIRQSAMQEILLRQALGRIMELEATAMASGRKRRPWWRWR